MLWLGDDTAAEDNAWQALTRLVNPDGHTEHPIRVAQTRLTLGVVAARRGDLEQAVYHGMAAVGSPRVCAPVLLARAGELHAALSAAGFGGEHAARELRDTIAVLARRYGLDGSNLMGTP